LKNNFFDSSLEFSERDLTSGDVFEFLTIWSLAPNQQDIFGLYFFGFWTKIRALSAHGWLSSVSVAKYMPQKRNFGQK